MAISKNIQEYINLSKVNGKICRWKKSVLCVYVTPLPNNIDNPNFYHSEISKGINVWNKCLKENLIDIRFELVETPVTADIIIHWTKVGRVYEGMCKYPSIINGEIKKVSIDVGLYNEYSPKNTTDESIFFTIMHELGHSLGLGHGIEIDDLMYVPHKKNISVPSDNDIYVLKHIYSTNI